MSFIKEKIKITCNLLSSAANRYLGEIQGTEYIPNVGYKKDNIIPTEGWLPFEKGQRVRGKDAHFWFRVKFKTPKAEKNYSYFARCVPGQGDSWNYFTQGLIYLNGEQVQGCDANHREIFLEPDRDYELVNYFYTGMSDNIASVAFQLFKTDERSEQLYYDIKVPYDSCMLLHPNTESYISVMSVLEQTANLIDFRDINSAEYFRSVEKASKFIKKELYEKLCSVEGKPIVSCIGHTHIDVEWQWHRAQTREKIQRSFATAKTLMEKYPEYKFMLSQPELYRYLKEEAPEKYEQLKELVKEGRWEPEGAMWLEADCNLISGESFVRQIIQGKKFFADEFGVDCKILFLPDVFGYSCALPQILKKSGIRHFVTSKISWNETNTMPVDCFMWQGLDGTEIFTNFITTQDYKGPDTPQRFTTYVGMLNPSEIKGTRTRFSQKEYTNRSFTTFGYGDGGGGPTKEMLETQRRLAKGLPDMPVTQIEGLLPYLDKVKADFDEGCKRTKRVPKWVGELYLEFHRGTYTSAAKVKRSNRKSEFMLKECEALSYIDLKDGGSYDADGIYMTWRKVLHNQFHDIIPGSSIKEVYDGTDIDYARISDFCNSLISEKENAIAAKINTAGGILLFNNLGFERKGIFRLNGKTAETNEKVPAFGYRVIKNYIDKPDVKLDGLCAENKYYIMTLDEAGRISSLYDKREKREVFKENEFGNEFQVFEDYPRQYDNWEITDYYKQKMYVQDGKAKITPFYDGSRAGFKVERQYMHSKAVQYISLYSESERIDFDNEIDWHEHHQLLKVAFPFDVQATSAAYEIQFGHVFRPTHENTSWDKAKFEVYGHKWADMSEKGYGVSLLNDCKYGHSTEGSTMKLTLIKCGTFPNPESDQGEHRFTYSLLPHNGDFCSAGTIREGYSLNLPLKAMKIEKQAGKNPESFGAVDCSCENIMIDTLKKAENDDGMIVRLYDSFGQRSEAKISVMPGFSKAFLCDLTENIIKELDFDGESVTVPVGVFEIITLKFTE